MNEEKQIEKPGWDILGKYLNNEASANEQEAVETWVNQSDANREDLEKTGQMLEHARLVYKQKYFNPEKGWQKVAGKALTDEPKISPHKFIRKEAMAKFYKYAAVVLIALLLGATGYYIGFRNPVHEIYSEVISPQNQVINEYILPDGSVVTLNSNSKIEFPKRFTGNIREVTLTGEAYFDVTPNPEKPFVINAGSARVEVLGTSFNVSVYPENEKVEVIVESGKVQVSRKKERTPEKSDKVLLNPGEKGTFIQKENKLEKSLNTDRNYLAWKTHNLVFQETPLKEVVEYLKKVYHIDIQLENKQLNELVLTAEFNKKPVDFILNVVQITFDLNLKTENGKYILSENNNINN